MQQRLCTSGRITQAEIASAGAAPQELDRPAIRCLSRSWLVRLGGCSQWQLPMADAQPASAPAGAIPD